MTRIAPLLMAAALVGCSAGNHGQVAGKPGQVKLSAKASPQLATSTGTAPLVCASFSLQPYSLDASGDQTLAGAPVTLTSVAASQTDTIAGCIDQGPTGPNPNWGYLVTATNFVDCTSGAAIPGLSPSTVTGNYPVDCQAGIDVSLSIVVNVSIAQANSAGYVDINAGVNATEVQVGCKQADIQQDGEHYGESYIDPNGDILQGLVGMDTTLIAGPAQFGGTVTGNPSPTTDTYYTGIIDPTTITTIFQTFLTSCPAKGQEYADTDHAQCVSDNGSNKGENGIPDTQASLADVFLEDPTNGYYISASLSGNAIVTYQSTDEANVMDATTDPVTLGYNDLQQNSIAAPTGYTFTGIYVDQSTADQLLLTATNSMGVPGYFTLAFPWKGLAPDPSAQLYTPLFNPLPDSSTQACLGLFASPSGCFTPKACVTACQAAESSIQTVEESCPQAACLLHFGVIRDVTTCAEQVLCQQVYEQYIQSQIQSNGNCCNLLPIQGSSPFDTIGGTSACSITEDDNGNPVACTCGQFSTGAGQTGQQCRALSAVASDVASVCTGPQPKCFGGENNTDVTTCDEAGLCALAYEQYVQSYQSDNGNCACMPPIQGSQSSACTITNGVCSCPYGLVLGGLMK